VKASWKPGVGCRHSCILEEADEGGILEYKDKACHREGCAGG